VARQSTYWFSFFTAFLLCLTSAAVSDDREKVVVGATLPLTGDLAHVGVDIQRGMELAIEELVGGPIQFEVRYEDNRHQTNRAVSSVQKLLEIDKVDVLVSLWDMADAVAPLADRKKVPHLSIRWNHHVAERHKYTVTFESTYATYVKSQVRLLTALGAKTLGLITEQSQGWTLSGNELARQAQKAGFQVVSHDTFVGRSADLRTIVTKTLSHRPDVVVINAHQPDLDLILKRIREQRPTQQVTGYFETVEPPSLVEDLPFVAQYRVAPWFEKKFRDRFNEGFKARAPHGYDIIKLLEHAYRVAGRKVSSDELIEALSSVSNFKGATGTLTTNATKNIENECVWQVVRGGKFVPLTQELLAEYHVPQSISKRKRGAT